MKTREIHSDSASEETEMWFQDDATLDGERMEDVATTHLPVDSDRMNHQHTPQHSDGHLESTFASCATLNEHDEVMNNADKPRDSGTRKLNMPLYLICHCLQILSDVPPPDQSDDSRLSFEPVFEPSVAQEERFYKVSHQALTDLILELDLLNASNAQINAVGQRITGTKQTFHNWRCMDRRTPKGEELVLDMCPRGCKAYLDSDNSEECEYCNQPRFRADGSRRRRFRYHKLAPRLIQDLQNPRTRELLRKPPISPSAHVSFHDVWDGKLFQKHLTDMEEFDQCIALLFDGARWCKSNTANFYFLSASPLNLPVEMRMREEHTYDLMVIDATNGIPPGLETFFRPFIDEMLSMASGTSFEVGEERRSFRAFATLALGDYPGLSTLISGRSHSSKTGCRFCQTVGKVQQKTRNHHPYFVFTLDELDNPPPLRDDADVRELQALNDELTDEDLHNAGLRSLSCFWELEKFVFPWSAPPDPMHCAILNMSKLLLECLGPSELNSTLQCAHLSRPDFVQILGIPQERRYEVDRLFGPSPCNWAVTSSFFSAEDYKVLMVYWLPSLLHDARVNDR